MELKEFIEKLRNKKLYYYGTQQLEKWLFKYIKGIHTLDITTIELSKELNTEDLIPALDTGDNNFYFSMKPISLNNVDYLLVYHDIKGYERYLEDYDLYVVIDKDNDDMTYTVHKPEVLGNLIQNEIKSSIELKDLDPKDLFILEHPLKEITDRKHFSDLNFFKFKSSFDSNVVFKNILDFFTLPISLKKPDIKNAYNVFFDEKDICYRDFYKIITKENDLSPNYRKFNIEILITSDTSEEDLKTLVFNLNSDDDMGKIESIYFRENKIVIFGCCNIYETTYDLQIKTGIILAKLKPFVFQLTDVEINDKIFYHGPLVVENENDIPF